MCRFFASFFVLFVFAGLAHAQNYVPPPSQDRNLLICGDASTCPNQRGTASIGGNIAGSGTMTLDAWEAIGGASSSINVSVVTPTNTIAGVSKVMELQRTSANANGAVINLGQVLDTDASTFVSGRSLCLSFDSMSGANFSGANNLLSYSVIAGQATTEGWASMVAGTWTSPTTVMSGTVTENALPQSTAKCATVPASTTELGINFSYTPTGTAGTNDWVQFARIQLEVVTPTPGISIGPTPYAFRTAGDELVRALRRAYWIAEPAASIAVASGPCYTTGLANFLIPFPIPMRAAPTVSFGSLSASTWAVISGSATPIALATTFLVQSALGAANTVYYGQIKATGASTPFTAGDFCQLVGAGGGSHILFSADLL